jgi:hypothetical protein
MGYFILFVALSLSAVAAWYSIAGLMVLFAAASLPVAIMASTLEIAKLVTASWLYNRWHRIPWALKTYLVFAVIVLMFVTSLGIFGFLSKAHLDQAMPVGDIATKIEIIDEKIKAEQANIDSAKVLLKQMDDAVNQALGRGAGNLPANATAAQQQAANTAAERNTNQSAALRKNQQKERDTQFALITKAQANIQKLREERAPFASQARTLEAEVGPIKYVAEMIWGSESKGHFDSAVRFLIITLIFVFDPLAVLLVIAANMTFSWNREDREINSPPPPPKLPDPPKTVKPNVHTFDSAVKIDLTNSFKSPILHSILSSANVGVTSATNSPSIVNIESNGSIDLVTSSNTEVDKLVEEVIIETVAPVKVKREVKKKLPKPEDNLEEVYSRIVEETKVVNTNTNTIASTLEELNTDMDEGLHRHSGGGTPPGSWTPPPRKIRQNAG